MTPAMIGALVNSAIYFAIVAAAAMLTHNHRALIAVIVAVGLTYLCFLWQITFPAQRKFAALLSLAAIAVGITAGLCLIAG